MNEEKELDNVSNKEKKELDDVSNEKPSLSVKLAKPIGRLQHEKDPRYRMPGLAPGQMDMSEVSQNIDERLMKMAKIVAKSLSSDSKDVKRTEAELELMLKSTAIERESGREGEPIQIDMMRVLKGFDVEKPIPKSEMKPGRFVQRPQSATTEGSTADRRGREWRQDDDSLPRRWYASKGSITQAIMSQQEQRSERRSQRVEGGETRRVEGGQTRRVEGGQMRRRPVVVEVYSQDAYGVFDYQVSQSLGQDDGQRMAKGERKQKSMVIGLKEAGERAEEREEGSSLLTWDKLVEEELSFAATQPPRNAFEEMILWTKQGKLWKYPIDNEQGN